MTDEWFKPVKIVTRTQHLQTFAKRRDRGLPLPVIRGARLVDIDMYRYPKVGTRIVFMGRLETFYTTRDFIKIFDIDKSTVYKWQKLGLIPDPLFTKMSRYNTQTKFYVKGQLVVVAKVVNDLRRQGLIRFRKAKLGHHLAMVEKGNKLALERWHKRRSSRKTKPPIKWID